MNISTLEKERTYLHHINYFRGIAIIFIVFSHCFNVGISHYNQNLTFLAKFLRNILSGGTTFFVFISGYLLHHIYYKNFQLKTFLLNKIKYILIPFILISSADICYYTIKYFTNVFIGSNKSDIYLEILNSYPFTNTYLFGHGVIPIGLWYIPFIVIIFVLTPFYLRFVRIKLNRQLLIICVLMLLSTLIHRTYKNGIIAIFQNVIYFTPAYLLGITMSINFKEFYEKLKGKSLYMLLIVLGISFQQTRNVVVDINSPSHLILANFDLMIVQKCLLSIFFIILLSKFENRQFKMLKILASNSFGIFFIHGICIWIFNAIVLKFNITYETNSILNYLLFSTVIFTLSLFLTILIRKLFPKNSKYLIGC